MISSSPRFQFALILVCLVLTSGRSAFGQARREPPQAFDPFKFFDEFSGQSDEQREIELAKIKISVKEENRIGEQELKAFRQQSAMRKVDLHNRGKDVEYVSSLVAHLQPLMKQAKRHRTIQVWLFDDDQPQAFALCGGQLILSSGMLDQAGSEAALLCVLGHELAHLDRGHLLRRAKQWKQMEQRFKESRGFGPDQLFGSLSAMQQLFRRPFGPEEELEADRDGIAWAYELGYDPLAINDLYAALDRPGQQVLPAFLQSHPPSAERRDNLKKTVEDLQKRDPKTDLIVGQENLADRRPALREE